MITTFTGKVEREMKAEVVAAIAGLSRLYNNA